MSEDCPVCAEGKILTDNAVNYCDKCGTAFYKLPTMSMGGKGFRTANTHTEVRERVRRKYNLKELVENTPAEVFKEAWEPFVKEYNFKVVYNHFSGWHSDIFLNDEVVGKVFHPNNEPAGILLKITLTLKQLKVLEGVLEAYISEEDR